MFCWRLITWRRRRTCGRRCGRLLGHVAVSRRCLAMGMAATLRGAPLCGTRRHVTPLSRVRGCHCSARAHRHLRSECAPVCRDFATGALLCGVLALLTGPPILTPFLRGSETECACCSGVGMRCAWLMLTGLSVVVSKYGAVDASLAGHTADVALAVLENDDWSALLDARACVYASVPLDVSMASYQGRSGRARRNNRCLWR